MIALGLGIGKDYFEGYIDASDNTLRLLHYPSAEKQQLNETSRRAGAHW